MALAFAHFGALDNGEMMPLAHLIRGITELLPRTVFDLALIVQSLESMTVQQVRIIEYAMQVRVLFIDVDFQQKLVLIFQKFLADVSDLSNRHGTILQQFPQ